MTSTQRQMQAVENDIAATRQRMRATIDQIQEHLSPQHLLSDARDSVLDFTRDKTNQMLHYTEETAQEAGNALSETLARNPLLGAALGIALSWVASIGKSQEQTK